MHQPRAELLGQGVGEPHGAQEAHGAQHHGADEEERGVAAHPAGPEEGHMETDTLWW